MNRALRAATMGALLVSPLAVGACSAGQIAQTETQVRDKVGGTAQVGDILVRALEVEFPSGGSFDRGDDVELLGALVNIADESDALVGIEGEAFEGVRVLGGTATGVSTGSAVDTSIDVEVPTDRTVFLGTGDDPTILLENLTEPLTAGDSILLTLTFERAGEVEVRAVVNNPDEALERGEKFDFHHEEEGELGESGLPESGAEVGGDGGVEGGDGHGGG